jgi:FixJ family two-component response regulator
MTISPKGRSSAIKLASCDDRMRETWRQFVHRLWESEERICVLAIIDSSPDRDSLNAFAVGGGWDFVTTGSCDEALVALRKRQTAVILFDRDLPGIVWQDALERLSSAAGRCAIVLLSPVNDEYLWEEVNRRGGYDVLVKPLREDQTTRAVNLAWSYAKERMRAADERG